MGCFLGFLILGGLLPGPSGFDIAKSVKEIRKSGDKMWAAPLADVLRFLRTPDQYLALAGAFERVTGTKLRSKDAIEAAVTWVGANENVPAPPGYTAWKGELFARAVDPRYREFLHEKVKVGTRIEEIQWGGVPVDGIPALVNPRMRPASEATYLTGAEPVFGVSLNGDHRAYPLRILDWHEMANDVVGGRAVALAYCTLCGAGILFDAAVPDGRRLFGSSGLLFRSNKLMYDRETKSLWNQFTGEPVVGPLVGSGVRLNVMPMVLASWEEWKRLHPDTKAADIVTGFVRNYGVGATYGRYFGSPGLMFPVWKQSSILPKKARVFALRVEGHPKAYPMDSLVREGGVVNDSAGPIPVVVIAAETGPAAQLPARWGVKDVRTVTLEEVRKTLKRKPGWIEDLTPDVLLAMPVEVRLPLLEERSSREAVGTGSAQGEFSANLRNEVAQRGLIGEVRAYRRASHTFKRTAEGIVDEQGRTWKMAEDALTSPSGERIERLPGHLAFWFGWYAFMPGTEVYGIATK